MTASATYLALVDAPIVLVPLRAHDGSIRAFAIVDEADAEFVNRWRWHLNKGYAQRLEVTWPSGKRCSQTIRLHRVLLGLVKGDGVEGDHINRNTLDDRRANLRALPKGVNSQNKPSYAGSSSQYRGVSWRKRRHKWSAGLETNGKSIHLGNFDTELEAAEAARAGRARLLPFAVD
jgi:hypothetical protein